MPVKKKHTKVQKVPDKHKDFYIVAIGASAGGLEALEKFFSHMPSDSGMAFVIVSHLAPDHKSILAEILSKYNSMKICQAEDGMQVKPDNVYVIPPNWDLVIMHETLQLLEPVIKHSLRHPIDTFFRSLAKDKKDLAIGIVLSGSGTEGVLGIRDIKEEGGLVMAQDTSSARYDSMPGAAIATGIVDYVLPPEKMPNHLIKHINKAIPGQIKITKEVFGGQSSSIQKIFVLIRDYTGNDFSLYKQKTMIRRIERRMAVHQLDNLEAYVKFIQHNPDEIEKLFKELLIRVTHFFRDNDAFSILKKQALPHLLKDKERDEVLRVWIPGCSTGEEAYSIAIIIQEFLNEHQLKVKVQIFATDIDEESIEKSRTGIYPESI
ncbi:MAG: hypothetical protein LWY06_03150, partial [Firmicutes bacterium]|nr:hypothetical protein [Bacillota bacterium]